MPSAHISDAPSAKRPPATPEYAHTLCGRCKWAHAVSGNEPCCKSGRLFFACFLRWVSGIIARYRAHGAFGKRRAANSIRNSLSPQARLGHGHRLPERRGVSRNVRLLERSGMLRTPADKLTRSSGLARRVQTVGGQGSELKRLNGQQERCGGGSSGLRISGRSST